MSLSNVADPFTFAGLTGSPWVMFAGSTICTASPVRYTSTRTWDDELTAGYFNSSSPVVLMMRGERGPGRLRSLLAVGGSSGLFSTSWQQGVSSRLLVCEDKDDVGDPSMEATVTERKALGSVQRILGPNTAGYYGLLQAFAEGLKLLLKEYVTERKALGSVQRILGPNTAGHYGLLQAFAEGLKLLLKEYVSPTPTVMNDVGAYDIKCAIW
ncbi:hypothetical protein V498_05023 [Pseudogymnoascus sp. VKM F-4517 (FW-2822)]|nr:hypothetical protein V498_05023 [Pseudogymnoascus sp. VKM F-4517 (FW-2822)]